MTRKIIVKGRIPAREVCQTWHEGPLAVISINGPDQTPNPLGDNPLVGPVLTLFFADSDEADGMSRADAQKVAAFVHGLPAGQALLVHCGAGVSRSAGVAAAIDKWETGDDMDWFRDRRPNMRCYRYVLEALMTADQVGAR